MSPIAAIAVFGVPEREVDALIEAVAGTHAEPGRWVVFGTDAYLLGALDRQWRNAVDLVVVRIPCGDIEMVDVALDVLANERLEPATVVWLHGTELGFDPPSGFRAVFSVSPGPMEHVFNLAMGLLE